MVLTGANGELSLGVDPIAKCRNWTVQVSRDAVEDTCLGSYDRSYIKGLRGGTGSASIFYDPTDLVASSLFDSIFDNSGTQQTLNFKLNSATGKKLSGSGFITSMSSTVTVGEATAMEVQFQFSGPISGDF